MIPKSIIPMWKSYLWRLFKLSKDFFNTYFSEKLRSFHIVAYDVHFVTSIARLICDLPSVDSESTSKDSIPDKSFFLISSSNPWYRDILYISRPIIFCLMPLALSHDVFDTKPRNTSSFVHPLSSWY